MNSIYTVKEAAKILGFSTNTVYKYLSEGRLKAARGELEQGRFRIPHQAIEEFLGTQIPQDILTHLKQSEPRTVTSNESTPPLNLVIPPSPPTLPLAVARVLIVFSLLATILDIIMSPTVSLFGQVSRIAAIGIFILLSYQYLGDKKEKYAPTTQSEQTIN